MENYTEYIDVNGDAIEIEEVPERWQRKWQYEVEEFEF